MLLLVIWPKTAVIAGARHFTYIYEAVTSAPGSFEIENWVTWSRTTNPERFDQVDFRHELEIGVTDRLQASIYLADWFYENATGHSGSVYSDSALELIYNLTNPRSGRLVTLPGIQSWRSTIRVGIKIDRAKEPRTAYSRIQYDARSNLGRARTS